MIKRHGLAVFLFCFSMLAGIALAIVETVTAFFFSTGILIFGGLVTALFAVAAVWWLVLKRKNHIRDPEQSIRHQGTAFGVWFAAHNLFWAFFGCLFIWGIFKLYGFRWWVIVFSAGALACTCFAFVGIFLIRQWNMLGLCWQSPIPDGLENFWARVGSAMILRERYEFAAKHDQKQHTPLLWSISRIFNRANSGGADRGIDLLEPRRGFLSKKLKKEWLSRLKILLVLFWVTVALAALPGILGYAGHHWNRVPDGWNSDGIKNSQADKPQMMASKSKPDKNSQKDDPAKDNAGDEDSRRNEDKKTEQDRQEQKGSDKDDKNSKTGQGRQSSDSGQNGSNRRSEGKQQGQEERKEGETDPGGGNNREPGQKRQEQAKGQKQGQDREQNKKQGREQEQEQEQRQEQGREQRGGEEQEQAQGQDQRQGQGKGEGKGKEQGQGQEQGHGKSQAQGQKQGQDQNQGQGKEQGQGQGQGQGKGKGEGQGEGQGKGEGEGKGQGQGQGQGQGKGEGKGEGQSQGENEGANSSSKEENPGEIQSGGAGKGSGEGQGQGNPDETPEMLSEPESLPEIPSRATDMVTLELPTLNEREGKGGKEPQEKKPDDQASLPGSKAPDTQFKTGRQESRASKPEQYLPNWILNLLKQKTTQTSTDRPGQKRK